MQASVAVGLFDDSEARTRCRQPRSSAVPYSCAACAACASSCAACAHMHSLSARYRRVILCSATFSATTALFGRFQGMTAPSPSPSPFTLPLPLQHHPPSSPSLFTITFPFTLCDGSPFILTLRHGSPFTLPFPFTLPLQYHPRLRSASPLPAPPPPPPHCSSDGNSGGCLRPAAAPPLTSASPHTPSRTSAPVC